MTTEYPTVILQWQAPSGTPPDMDLTPMDLAMALGPIVASINQMEGVQCDLVFGTCSKDESRELQQRLEGTSQVR